MEVGEMSEWAQPTSGWDWHGFDRKTADGRRNVVWEVDLLKAVCDLPTDAGWDDALEVLTGALLSVPAEHRGGCKVVAEEGWGEDRGKALLVWVVPETDDEFTARIARETAEAEAAAARSVEIERAAYLRLKVKFEGSGE